MRQRGEAQVSLITLIMILCTIMMAAYGAIWAYVIKAQDRTDVLINNVEIKRENDNRRFDRVLDVFEDICGTRVKRRRSGE